MHVARGSEPRLLSFFDLRVVFGRSMVNLYSVAKIRARAIILLRRFPQLGALCIHGVATGVRRHVLITFTLNRAPFNRALRWLREVLNSQPPRRTSQPGAAQRTALLRKPSSPSRCAPSAFLRCEAGQQSGARRKNRRARKGENKACQFIAHIGDVFAHLGKDDGKVLKTAG